MSPLGKRYGLISLATLLGFNLFCGVASAYTLSEHAADTNVVNTCGYAVTDTGYCAVSFTTIGGGDLSSANFAFSSDGGLGTYTYHLQADSGGSPSNTDLSVSTDSFLAAVVPPTTGFNSCNDLADPGAQQLLHFSGATLDPSTTYWIVIETDTMASTGGLRMCGSSGTDGTVKNTTSDLSTWTISPHGPAYYDIEISGSTPPVPGGFGSDQFPLERVILALGAVFLMSLVLLRLAPKFEHAIESAQPSEFLQKRFLRISLRSRRGKNKNYD